MHWPWKRFEVAFEAMVRRQMVEEMLQRKISMTSALYANTNMDSPEADRAGSIQAIEEAFSSIVISIYGGSQKEEPIDKNNPFFGAMKLPEIAVNLPEFPWNMEKEAVSGG